MPFFVSTSGNFSLTAESHGTFDLIELIYNSSFNVNTPLGGYLTGVNAAGSGGDENLTALPFTSNTLYYAVTTGFKSTDNGPFVLTFSGPSSVTVVYPPQMAGDFDRNGSVNGDDYTKWTSTFGSTVTFFAVRWQRQRRCRRCRLHGLARPLFHARFRRVIECRSRALCRSALLAIGCIVTFCARRRQNGLPGCVLTSAEWSAPRR